VYAVARLDKNEWAETGLIGVPVSVSEDSGSEVARAVVSFAVAMRID